MGNLATTAMGLASVAGGIVAISIGVRQALRGLYESWKKESQDLERQRCDKQNLIRSHIKDYCPECPEEYLNRSITEKLLRDVLILYLNKRAPSVGKVFKQNVTKGIQLALRQALIGWPAEQKKNEVFFSYFFDGGFLIEMQSLEAQVGYIRKRKQDLKSSLWIVDWSVVLSGAALLLFIAGSVPTDIAISVYSVGIMFGLVLIFGVMALFFRSVINEIQETRYRLLAGCISIIAWLGSAILVVFALAPW